MKNRLVFLVCLLSIKIQFVFAQWSGPTPVTQFTEQDYVFATPANYTYWWFEADGGEVIAEDHVDDEYFVTVRWTVASSTNKVRLWRETFANGQYINVIVSSMTVTATGAVPPTPSGVTMSQTQNCGSTTITRNASPPAGAYYSWHWQTSADSQTLGPSEAYTNIWTNNQQIWLRARSNSEPHYWSASSLYMGTVSVIPIPPKPTVSSPVTYCQYNTALQLTATGSNLRWYTLQYFTPGTGSTTAPTPSTASPGSTTYWVTQTVNGCEGGAEPITVNVTAKPSMPGVSPVSYCHNVTAQQLTASGTNLKWYSTLSSGETGSTTAPIPSTGTVGQFNYYVSQTQNGCESERATLVVNVYAIPSAPSVPSTIIYYCRNDETSTLTATGQNLKWYSASGTLLPSAPTPSSFVVGTTRYKVTQTINGCESAVTDIDVVVNAIPSQPLVTTPISYCKDATAAVLSATGTNLKWYDAATAGALLSGAPTPTTNIVGTKSYYVTQTISGCESTPRTEIAVTTKAVPSAPNATTLYTYCQNAAATQLTATGSNLKWYTSLGGTSTTTAPTPSTSAAGTTSYWVTETTAGCEGPATQINVVVNALPAAPTASNASSCGGVSVELTATPPASALVNWYDASTGGNSLGSGNTLATGTLAQSKSFFAQSFNNSTSCSSTSRTEVIVTFVNKPVIPTGIADQVIFGSGTLTLNATPGQGADQIKWYETPVSNPALHTGTSYQPSVTVTKYYYISSLISSVNCESDRTPFSVIVAPAATPASVIVETIRDKGTTTELLVNALNNTTQKTQQVTYFDGLMRPFQSITVASSPAGKDIISFAEYDANGRASTSYLPYIGATTDGSLHTSYKTEQDAFYDTSNDKIANDDKPYAQTLFEDSPLGRPLKQGGVGTDWQLDQHVKSLIYTFNVSTDNVRRFNADGTSSSFYAANKLFKSVITNEEGNQVVSFTDDLGRTVLQRTQLDELINGQMVNWLETYTVYDEFGRIKYTISPKGVAQLQTNGWSLTQTIKDQYVYEFKYDKRGRVTEKKVPGSAWMFYIYDDANRLVLMQDGLLRNTNQWMFIKYDHINRTVMQGLYTNTVNTTRDAMQLVVNGITPSFETRGSALEGYTNVSFPTTNQSGSALDVLSVNYYDNHDFDNVGGNDFGYTTRNLAGEVVPTAATAKAHGLTTGSKRKILNTSTWLYTYVFYDHRGRVVQVRSDNHLSATKEDLTTNVYDFEGKLLLREMYHKAGAGKVTTVINKYAYDNKGRLIKVLHSNNGAADQVLARYGYNELGQLVSKKLHMTGSGQTVTGSPLSQPGTQYAQNLTANAHYAGTTQYLATTSVTLNPGFDTGIGSVVDVNTGTYSVGDAEALNESTETYLQEVDYRYNIRGQIVSINNAALVNDNSNNDDSGSYTGDYFGLELLYNTTETGINNTKYYDGNISAIKWKGPGMTQGAADQQSYKFAYDKSDKLKSAQSIVSRLTDDETPVLMWDSQAGVINEAMNYDHNGNILTLQRNEDQKGLTIVNSVPVVTHSAQTIDNLTYTYTSGNPLSKVEDATGHARGFTNGSTATTEYSYDVNGNLTEDKNKGITNIVYNFLGKPTQMTFSDGRVISYVYDAAGSKLSMSVTQNSVTNTTDYAGNFVYENGNLSFFGSPEGRVVKNGSNLEYQYSIADHQGNTRVVFTSAAQTPDVHLATFEDPVADENDFDGIPTTSPHWATFTAANNTPGGQKVVRMNQNLSIGPRKSLKVYPGDKVDMEVWTHHANTSGFGNSSPSLTSLITAVAGAFGGVSGAPGESGLKYNGVNSALSNYGTGGNQGDAQPAAYLNYILFDMDYKVMDMGWVIVPSSENTKAKISIPTVEVKTAGHIFVYLSYEDESNNYVEFDDFKVTHTKTNVIQYNEYYPFGYQTANSWTRENSSNNYLYNQGNELNPNSGWYETFFRGYDPAIGRFLQVDPMSFSEQATYQYAANNPTYYTDPAGASAFAGPRASIQFRQKWIEDFGMGAAPESWFDEWANSVGGPYDPYSSSGGGGGGGSRGRRGSGMYMQNGNLIIDFNAMGQSGGHWDRINGYRDFGSDEEAFAAGAAYNFQHNSWGNTYYGSYEASLVGYLALRASGELLTPSQVHSAIDKVRNGNGPANLYASLNSDPEIYVDNPGVPLMAWTDPSSLKIKKIGDAWYGSAHIQETIMNGLFKSVKLNTTVNFMFLADRNKKETQFLLAKSFDVARVAVFNLLEAQPAMRSVTAGQEFKAAFGISLMLTFWSSQVVTEFNYFNVPTFEVKFQWLPPISPLRN